MSLNQNARRGQVPQPRTEVKKESGPKTKRIHADVPAAHHRSFLIQLMQDDLQMKDVVAVLTELYLTDEELRRRVKHELRA